MHSFAFLDRQKAKSLLKQDMSETKLDPADIDVVATDDDRKAADKNPVIQLRRIADLPRGGDMEFKNGKKVKLKQQEARRLLKGFDSLRKNPDKQKFQSAVGKDHATLKRILKMIR